MLQTIWGLGQAIQNGDTATISSDLTSLNDAFDHINTESAINGSTLSELTNQQSAINVIQTNEKSTLSNLQDTDMAAATTKLAAGTNSLPGCPPGYRNTRQPQPGFATYFQLSDKPARGAKRALGFRRESGFGL